MNLNLQMPRKQGGFIQFVGLGLAALSAVKGAQAGRAQKKARLAQLQANRIRNFQAQRQFMRNFRQAQAQALAQGIAGGADPSSSFTQATMASEQAQVKTAQRDFAELGALGEQATASLNKAATLSTASSLLGTAASFAMSPAGSDFLSGLGGSGTPKPPSGGSGNVIG